MYGLDLKTLFRHIYYTFSLVLFKKKWQISVLISNLANKLVSIYVYITVIIITTY